MCHGQGVCITLLLINNFLKGQSVRIYHQAQVLRVLALTAADCWLNPFVRPVCLLHLSSLLIIHFRMRELPRLINSYGIFCCQFQISVGCVHKDTCTQNENRLSTSALNAWINLNCTYTEHSTYTIVNCRKVNLDVDKCKILYSMIYNNTPDQFIHINVTYQGNTVFIFNSS